MLQWKDSYTYTHKKMHDTIIPLFKTSMIFTTIGAFLAMQWLAPVLPPEIQAFTEVASLQPAGPMLVHSLLPVDRRRNERLERLHRAANDVSDQGVVSPASSVQPIAVERRIDNVRGVYLTATSIAREAFVDETIDKLLASGGNAVIFDVKGSGVLFRSSAPMANEINLVRGIYDLPAIIRKLKERDVYVIGRFVAIKDDALTAKRPETQIRHPKTNQVLSQTWVDPASDTAIEFNAQVMCEIVAAGIDEVNMDYIRFSTAEFGALLAYSAEEKADRLEKFIRAMRETIDRCGPDTKLGLSTYAILGWNYEANVRTLGQDVVRFAPLVDIISPMAYPATFTSAGYYVPGKNPGPRMFYLVYRTLTGYAELLGPEHSHKIRPWIQGYGVTTRDMSEQIRAVYEAGFCGWQVWSAGNNYGPTYAAMASDTIRPERCKDAPTVVPYIPPLSF